MMDPRNPNSSSTRSTFRQPYTTFRPWNLQRLNQAAQNEHQRQQQRSPQLYSNDELIIKIPSSVQSMSPISPTRLPPTPVSEGSKTAEIPSFATYGIQSPLDSQASEDAPPPVPSSRLPVTTTTEVTTWASPSNDTPHNDDIHFADQRHEPWFEKTPSFDVCSAVGPPSPQHSTDRLALRATTTTITTNAAAAASTSAFNHYPSAKHDENRKISSKMYSDHIDQWRPISPPSNNHHSLPSTHYHPPPSSQQRNNNNPWSSATLVDSWEGFHSFAQTVKPTSAMKFPKRYRLPDQDDDTLQVRDEEQHHMDTQVDNDYQQQQDEDQQQQPLSSGSSDQYEDAMSSPPKSDYDAQEQDNILMVFDDLGPDQPIKENKSQDDKVDEDDDAEEGDWIFSSKLGEQSTHTIRRYSRDELMDMKPESNQDNVLGQGAKQRIDNFIDARQSAKRHVKVHISRTPREPPVNGDDIGFQPGIPPPMQSKNVTMYIDL
ncbi:hypothetical protein K492DRAFT_237315 [Lichtheimia hyalospora FSU 10163]|nr:hypothetical protein K492DRAFT_237315 [Lichtheimia hyalospora FSU 10163]